MKLLLDTHIALWAITDDPKLSRKARERILASTSEIHVSAATVWEVALKHALKREAMPISGREALRCFREAGYDLLPITPEHCAAIEDLPLHHADPFDRILIAQALSEPLTLLTRDTTVASYSEAILSV